MLNQPQVILDYTSKHWVKIRSHLVFYFWHPSPLQAEAGMEFTSWPRMLGSQPTSSTETRTRHVRIQSPTHYPLGHHVSTLGVTEHKYPVADGCASHLSCTPTKDVTWTNELYYGAILYYCTINTDIWPWPYIAYIKVEKFLKKLSEPSSVPTTGFSVCTVDLDHLLWSPQGDGSHQGWTSPLQGVRL